MLYQSTKNNDVNIGFKKFNALDNEVVGKKLHIFVIDLQGYFYHLSNKIKIYRPGSLFVVENWGNEGKNLNLPCRFYPQAEYSIFPKRKIEDMTINVRMFGRDLELLQKKWKNIWLDYEIRSANLAEKFCYFSTLTENEVDV